MNGSAGNSDSVTGITPCLLQIGARTSSVPNHNYFNGAIGEILIYNRPILTNSIYGAAWSDRQIVECYLSAKYGIPLAYTCP
jgi:hypothetical protein